MGKVGLGIYVLLPARRILNGFVEDLSELLAGAS